MFLSSFFKLFFRKPLTVIDLFLWNALETPLAYDKQQQFLPRRKAQKQL